MGKLFSKSKVRKYSKSSKAGSGDGMGGVESHPPDNSYLATTDYRAHIHEEAVTSVAGVRQGVTVSGGKDKAVILYDIEKGQILDKWKGHENGVTQVLHGGVSGCMYSSSRDTCILTWLPGSGEPQNKFTGHTLVVTSIHLNQEETKLVSGSRDNTVRLWDVEMCQEIRQSSISRNLVNSVKFVPDSNLVVQCGEDKEVRVFDIRTMEVAFSFPRKQYIQMCCDVSQDGHSCLTCSNGFGGSGCEATLWDLRSISSKVAEFKGHSEAVESVCFLPHNNGCVFATSSRDCSIRIWDLHTKECLTEMYFDGSGPLTSIAPFSDGSLCVGSFNSGIQYLCLSMDGNYTLKHKVLSTTSNVEGHFGEVKVAPILT